MAPAQWIGLAVRLFSIWLAISAVQFMVGVPLAIAQANMQGTALAYVFGFVYLALAGVLWMFPMTVAHALIPKTADTSPLDPGAFNLGRVAVVVFGLWLVATKLQPSVLFIYSTIAFSSQGSVFGAMTLTQRVYVVVDFVLIVIGLLFVLRAGALTRFLLAR